MCFFAEWLNGCPLWSSGMWWLPLLFLVLCLVGMFFCFRTCFSRNCMPWSNEGKQSNGVESPLDIAKRRFAKGEISKEEYEDIKRTIA
jgi:putative membrane protein